MSSEHIETGRKLKQKASVADFEEILSRCAISDNEKKVLRMHYVQKQDFQFIGDTLGVSKWTAMQWNRAAIEKLSKVL